MRKKLTIFSFLILCFSTMFFAACNDAPVNTKFMVKVLCDSEELLSQEHKITEEIDYENLASSNGYNLDGIYTNADYTEEFVEGNTLEPGSTLYIKVSPINYSISYSLNLEGYEINNPISYNVRSEEFLLKSPFEGKRSNFKGWFVKGQNGESDKLVTKINPSDMKNYDLVGKWDYSMFNVEQENINKDEGDIHIHTRKGRLTLNGSPILEQNVKNSDQAVAIRKDLVTKYDVLVVPEKKGQATVSSIGWGAFYSREVVSTLEKIILPNSINTFDSQAFYECVNLKEINIPKYIVNIPDSTFYGCKSLSSIKLPEGLLEIEKDAFANTGLTSINIPANVNDIGANPFAGCNSLSTITVDNKNGIYKSEGNAIIKDKTLVVACKNTVIPDYITIIGASAYSRLNITAISFADNIQEIQDNAFFESKVKDVVLPTNLLKMGKQVFANCENIEAITIPSSLKVLGYAAFSYCINLKEVNLVDGLEEIGDRAFNMCKSLTAITLPSSLVKIGGWAFATTNLTEITIPSKVVSVGLTAFYNSILLEKVYIDSETFASQLVVETNDIPGLNFHFSHTIKEVYINTAITGELSADLQNTELFEKVESDKVSYNKYIKK